MLPARILRKEKSYPIKRNRRLKKPLFQDSLLSPADCEFSSRWQRSLKFTSTRLKIGLEYKLCTDGKMDYHQTNIPPHCPAIHSHVHESRLWPSALNFQRCCKKRPETGWLNINLSSHTFGGWRTMIRSWQEWLPVGWPSLSSRHPPSHSVLTWPLLL